MLVLCETYTHDNKSQGIYCIVQLTKISYSHNDEDGVML